MWSVVVALPYVQAEFDTTRGAASVPYTLTMLGFGAGGIMMGRLSDQFGPMKPLLAATLMLTCGYVLAGLAPSLTVFALAQGVLIGMFGASAAFAPLIADASLWFRRRRGIAVAIAASGNYLAGAVWPPILNRLMDAHGWRMTYLIVGAVCLMSMTPLAFMLRTEVPGSQGGNSFGDLKDTSPLGYSRTGLTVILSAAGIACCVAMAMPQVHIVAYCGDLSYGVARGAEMLSVMLTFGILSRLAFGVITDRIGGLRTLMLGSVMQGLALSLFLFFDTLASLYILSAVFGLVQGGIVPSYAVVVRENFPASEAGTRVGIVLMATLVGMALGGWLSGVIFDSTGSYAAAFLNGVVWNMVNVLVVATLLLRNRARFRTV
jgi:MFS family permease